MTLFKDKASSAFFPVCVALEILLAGAIGLHFGGFPISLFGTEHDPNFPSRYAFAFVTALLFVLPVLRKRLILSAHASGTSKNHLLLAVGIILSPAISFVWIDWTAWRPFFLAGWFFLLVLISARKPWNACPLAFRSLFALPNLFFAYIYLVWSDRNILLMISISLFISAVLTARKIRMTGSKWNLVAGSIYATLPNFMVIFFVTWLLVQDELRNREFDKKYRTECCIADSPEASLKMWYARSKDNPKKFLTAKFEERGVGPGQEEYVNYLTTRRNGTKVRATFIRIAEGWRYSHYEKLEQ